MLELPEVYREYYDRLDDKGKIEQLEGWLTASRQRESYLREEAQKDYILQRLQEINTTLHCRGKRGVWDSFIKPELDDPGVIAELLINIDIMIGHICRRVASGVYQIPERVYEDDNET